MSVSYCILMCVPNYPRDLPYDLARSPTWSRAVLLMISHDLPRDLTRSPTWYRAVSLMISCYLPYYLAWSPHSAAGIHADHVYPVVFSTYSCVFLWIQRLFCILLYRKCILMYPRSSMRIHQEYTRIHVVPLYPERWMWIQIGYREYVKNTVF